ncbi:MAG: D-glycerate dehydrogenase, partial [Alphaproteobacteria bacterium]
MANEAAQSRKPIDRKPRVIVTRHLMPSVEARMAELFDAQLNSDDVPFTNQQLRAAMR